MEGAGADHSSQPGESDEFHLKWPLQEEKSNVVGRKNAHFYWGTKSRIQEAAFLLKFSGKSIIQKVKTI